MVLLMKVIAPLLQQVPVLELVQRVKLLDPVLQQQMVNAVLVLHAQMQNVFLVAILAILQILFVMELQQAELGTQVIAIRHHKPVLLVKHQDLALLR